MVEHQWFTRQNIEAVVATRSTTAQSANLAQALMSAPTAGPDDRIALIARLGGDKVLASWIWFIYGHISNGGRLVRVAAVQNHHTRPEFRGLGIGTHLIRESLNVGLPCIYSGMSDIAPPLYKKQGISFLDESPIYRLPTSLRGVLRNWRDGYYEARVKGRSTLAWTVKSLLPAGSHMRTGTYHRLLPGGCDAIARFKHLAAYRHRRFQVPWNLDLYASAMHGNVKDLDVVVLEDTRQGKRDARFTSIYSRRTEVRLPGSDKTVPFVDGHINEICPPIDNADTARGIIGALAMRARTRSLDGLSIHATTPALQEACAALALRCRGQRTFAMKPVAGPDERLSQDTAIRENWWFRAMNENQLEETAAGSLIV
jgi:GNAT superfamily N-acetyltransferase